MTKVANNILALDVGERRIGVAMAGTVARIASPLTTLSNDERIFTALQELIQHHKVGLVVVGRPRNQQGETTAQTQAIEAFVVRLQSRIAVEIAWQDESLTSLKAEAELQQHGKIAPKGAVDALAATYILDDYLLEHGSVS